jgi:hypothetical protein
MMSNDDDHRSMIIFGIANEMKFCYSSFDRRNNLMKNQYAIEERKKLLSFRRSIFPIQRSHEEQENIIIT